MTEKHNPQPLARIPRTAGRVIRLQRERDELLAFAQYVVEMDPTNDAPLFTKARAAVARATGKE